MIGTKTLQEVLSDREAIANQMEAQLDEGTEPWGIKVERVEMYVPFATQSFVYSCSF